MLYWLLVIKNNYWLLISIYRCSMLTCYLKLFCDALIIFTVKIFSYNLIEWKVCWFNIANWKVRETYYNRLLKDVLLILSMTQVLTKCKHLVTCSNSYNYFSQWDFLWFSNPLNRDDSDVQYIGNTIILVILLSIWSGFQKHWCQRQDSWRGSAEFEGPWTFRSADSRRIW